MSAESNNMDLEIGGRTASYYSCPKWPCNQRRPLAYQEIAPEGINMNNDDYVAFRVGSYMSNDLRLLFAAIGKCEVQWYTRLQMRFMATCGPQWEPFSKGPALRLRLPGGTT